MERGHQERLAPMAADVMAHAKLAFSDIGKIVVTVGPGSFTGLRVGLAFAKGLHLATGAPLAGIGALEALAASADPDGQCAGVIDARRGMVYLQAFEAGRSLCEADVLPASEAANRLEAISLGRWRVAGPGAQLLAGADNVDAVELAAPDLMALGELAQRATPTDDLRPIYLREPDARPMPA
jgi:tRNA threonylcarbamoyladenosine biosynthesis protein TsaB